jgi:hypothetical protein
VAAVAAALAVVAAVVGVEEQTMNRTFMNYSATLATGIALALFSTTLLATPANYPTADAAATALVDAVQAHDQAAMVKVLGQDWKTFIPTDDIDKEDVDAFLDAYKARHKIVEKDGVSRLEVGDAGWTLPIPIVKSGAGYTFDLKAGHDEMIARQIGRNELDTQQALLAFYDAQRDYALTDHNGDGVLEYAQKFVSTPGKHDGLYCVSKDESDVSPLGPLFAAHVQKPAADGYLGYHYKILTAQGTSAPGGAYNYVVGGRMRNGFAAISWPVRYGETGVMSFMISHDGLVFEKDLGKNGAAAVEAMKTFDPDDSWHEDDHLDDDAGKP